MESEHRKRIGLARGWMFHGGTPFGKMGPVKKFHRPRLFLTLFQPHRKDMCHAGKEMCSGVGC